MKNVGRTRDAKTVSKQQMSFAVILSLFERLVKSEDSESHFDFRLLWCNNLQLRQSFTKCQLS
jgi:hypothetical protein